MRAALVLVALAACGSSERAAPAGGSGSGSAAPVKPAAPTAEQLLTGGLPDAPEADLARGKCQLCHTEQYLVEQRLSPEGWKKTLAKMKKFGAPITDDEEARLATWLASLYTPDLPMREGRLVERPAMALPAK